VSSVGPSEAPPAAPPSAEAAFGGRPDGLALATRYAQILAGRGIEHGLIGPRERDRLWERHLVNCAVVAELLPPSTMVADIGSGAGLPGIALACARADLSVTLVEPLERRVRFLVDTVAELGLGDQLTVLHGRADSRDVLDRLEGTRFATARAVAPLDRLVGWCLPLLVADGELLAMKGRTAEAEIGAHGSALAKLGARGVELRTCGSAILEEPVRVVAVRRQPYTVPPVRSSGRLEQ
jgi:16S rRNA (guanine527-N7)-methyltransferase